MEGIISKNSGYKIENLRIITVRNPTKNFAFQYLLTKEDEWKIVPFSPREFYDLMQTLATK